MTPVLYVHYSLTCYTFYFESFGQTFSKVCVIKGQRPCRIQQNAKSPMRTSTSAQEGSQNSPV